jgi:phage tail-like protein
LSFAEVSGLSSQYDAVIYKHGLSFTQGDKIIPGMRQPIKLTLKRGIAQSRSDLHRWLGDTVAEPASSSAKRDILIDLCDEQGLPLIRWLVQGALPVKLDAPAFNASSNEVAIETVEFMAHGLQIDYNP